jgi:hypothetical protein
MFSQGLRCYNLVQDVFYYIVIYVKFHVNKHMASHHPLSSLHVNMSISCHIKWDLQSNWCCHRQSYSNKFNFTRCYILKRGHNNCGQGKQQFISQSTPQRHVFSSCQQVNTKWLAQGSRGFLLLFLHWIYRQRMSVTLHWVQAATILRWAIVVKETTFTLGDFKIFHPSSYSILFMWPWRF